MKNFIYIFLSIITLGCSSPKEDIKGKMESVYGKAITSKETPDGTKYTLLYSVLEEDRFNEDSRTIKEYIDKISGSLPITEVEQLLSDDQRSMSDMKAWETPTVVVLLSKGTRLTNKSNDKRPYIIDVIVREK